MMHSDYYAISSCAFSVVFIPFLILSSMQFALALQAFNYENRKYFAWLKCTFTATCLPLALISGISLLAQACLGIYLTHTYFEELRIIIFYAAWLLLASIVLVLGWTRYARTLGRSMWLVPRINDKRMQVLLIATSLIWSFALLALNLYGWRAIIYFVPLATPLATPLVNACMRPYPGRVTPRPHQEWEGAETPDA